MEPAPRQDPRDRDHIFRVAPPADLQPLVEAFAGRTASVVRAKFPVFPTARAELMFHFADPFLIGDAATGPMRRLASAALLGPRERNHWQSAGPRIDWFMVQLTALGCQRILGLRFGDAWHREIALADLWGKSAVLLHEQMRHATSFSARMALATAALRDRFGAHVAVDRVSEAGSLARAGGIRSLEALCTHLDVGARRLHQLFARTYAVSPKSFLGIMRFGRQLQSLHSLAAAKSAAREHEYYDDSHAIRDFRRFSEMTPSAYIRQKSCGDGLIHTGPAIAEPDQT
jgi:AraC-like DNA-binding protein